jgi:hypothetical protein
MKEILPGRVLLILGVDNVDVFQDVVVGVGVVAVGVGECRRPSFMFENSTFLFDFRSSVARSNV